MSKELKGSMRKMSYQIKIINRDWNYFKNRNSGVKIIMTEIKNSLEGLNNRFELEEERINESE